MEEWRKVPDIEYLWASSKGRIKSEPYQTPMPRGGFKTNELKPTLGFIQTMSKNYKRKLIIFRRKTYKVSSLVAKTFLGEKPIGYDVSHKDENSFNNSPENLIYETRKDNLNRPKIKEYHKKVCRLKMMA